MSTNASLPRFRSSKTADRDQNANASEYPASNRISTPLKKIWKHVLLNTQSPSYQICMLCGVSSFPLIYSKCHDYYDKFIHHSSF